MNTLLITLALIHPGILAALKPIVQVGTGGLLSWLITFLIIAAVVTFVIWIVSKFAGPPSIPEPFRWIIWVIVAIALLVFVFAALGIAI
jgi:hypothetical protein